jgi:DNA-binding MarR family transcriptional regulator
MAQDTRWLTEEEMRAWRAFLGAAMLLDRRLDQQLKDDAGLTHVQYEILARLSGAPDRELRMTHLADVLHVSPSALTYQVTQLERAGLVRRRPCPSGPRAVYAVLTDAGWSVLERAAPGHVTAVREMLIDVLAPEELTAIADGLGRVRDRMLNPDT